MKILDFLLSCTYDIEVKDGDEYTLDLYEDDTRDSVGDDFKDLLIDALEDIDIEKDYTESEIKEVLNDEDILYCIMNCVAEHIIGECYLDEATLRINNYTANDFYLEYTGEIDTL